MKNRQRKKEISDEEREIIYAKKYFDRISPGVIKFYSDHYICGNFYKSVWAIKKFTKPLFSIPTHHFLFNPENISPAAFIDTLQLEPAEFDLIKFPERGTCLYRCGNERYLLVVIAPQYKAKLFGTAGEDKMKEIPIEILAEKIEREYEKGGDIL